MLPLKFHTMNRSKVCCKAGSVDFFKQSTEKVSKVWVLTAVYCLCKNTHLAAFYEQTKNSFYFFLNGVLSN